MGNQTSKGSINTITNELKNNVLVEYMHQYYPNINISELSNCTHPYDHHLIRMYNEYFNGNDGTMFLNVLEEYCGDQVAKFIYNCLYRTTCSTITQQQFIIVMSSIIESIQNVRDGYLHLLNVVVTHTTTDTENTKHYLIFILENAFRIVSNYNTSWPNEIPNDDKIFKAYLKYIGQNNLTSLPNIQNCMPRLCKLSTGCFCHIFCGYNLPLTHIPFVDITKSQLLSSGVFAIFCCILPDCYVKTYQDNIPHDTPSPINTWSLIYSSNIHGKSINRFKNCCFDYFSPTIMLISLNDGSLFSIGVDSCWRNEPQCWGGSMCFFYQLYPTYIEILHGEKIIYFNERSRSLPNGILIGANYYNPIFTIDVDLLHTKLTHKNYHTSQVSIIEVYGCDSKLALTKKHDFTKTKLKIKENSTKINTKTLWQDNVDRKILEFGGLNVSNSENYSK